MRLQPFWALNLFDPSRQLSRVAPNVHDLELLTTTRLADLVRLSCHSCGWQLHWNQLPPPGRPAACPACWASLLSWQEKPAPPKVSSSNGTGNQTSQTLTRNQDAFLFRVASPLRRTLPSRSVGHPPLQPARSSVTGSLPADPRRPEEGVARW